MTIKTFKLDNGEELTIDTSSDEFHSYERAAHQIGVLKKDESFFMAQSLEFLRQQAFKPVYAEMKLLNGGLLSLNTAIPEGAETDTYEIHDSTGEAKIISDFGDDIPTAEVLSEPVSHGIKSLAGSYIYSIQDMRRDKMVNRPGYSVVTNKMMAARMSVDQKLERMLGFGSIEHGITGMFNNAQVPVTAVAASGTGASTLWASKSGQQILDDISSAIDDIGNLTDDNEAPDTMIVSGPGYRLMEKLALDQTNYSGMSVLKYVETQYSLKVVKMQQLKKAFNGGNDSGFCLYKNSQFKLEGVLPIRLRPHAPQIKNLATTNILEARCGGTRVFFPYSMGIHTGI